MRTLLIYLLYWLDSTRANNNSRNTNMYIYKGELRRVNREEEIAKYQADKNLQYEWNV